MLHWLYYAILFVVLLCGLVLNLFTLPGNWLMLAGVAIYALATHFVHVGLKSLVVLLVIAVVAEVLELSAAGKEAKKVGGGRWGSIGALIGGILGGMFLTFVPVPIVSTIVGILLGTFLGAMAGELIGGKDVGRSAIIGVGAAKGRAYGTLLKIASGFLIMLISLIVAIPWPSQTRAAAAAAATQPSGSGRTH
jgi:uncharacterized protein YqgC (DUF456 family)